MSKEEFNTLSGMVNSIQWNDVVLALEIIGNMEWEIHSKRHKRQIGILINLVGRKIRTSDLPSKVSGWYRSSICDELHGVTVDKKAKEQIAILKNFIISKTK